MFLVGKSGAGKSTLMSVLFGLYQPEEGCIKKNGQVVKLEGNPVDPMSKGKMCAKGLSGI